ncbi:hypothetical protein BKA61DRAFT_564754 [Leptodontidium sp. MPI-SDFR-AT-0119]|nr:hypothetical protein BKA61DRAFT_564754 [Leptodontidium sp. MPI-SDFR-AT-0119]
MSSPTLKIAILGAGPGGLTLASLLSSSSTTPIFYTIFELRPQPPPLNATSSSSGSLDLHGNSGLLALSACGLMPAFEALKRECSEESIITDMKGEVKWRDEGFGERPEIERGVLMGLLLGGVEEGRVRWGVKVVGVERGSKGGGWGEGKEIEEEEQEEFDIVIDASGAHSRARTVLSPTTLFYSSISCLTLTIPHLDTMDPSLAKLVGSGSFMAMGYGKAVMSQRGTEGAARIYVMLRTGGEGYLKESGLDVACKRPEELKRLLLAEGGLFENWGEGVRGLIERGCDAEAEALTRPLYMLPTDFTWLHQKGLTLIGDAAHLMTPFAGEGVNCAMLDALEVSKAILSCLSLDSSLAEKKGREEVLEEIDGKIERFEREMWKRMHPIQEETVRNLEMMMCDERAPEGFVEWMKGMFEAAMKEMGQGVKEGGN